MNTISIEHLLDRAAYHYGKYESIYKDFSHKKISFESLPIIKHDEVERTINSALSESLELDGILTMSSGTTGVPKVSLFDSNEWEASHKKLAEKHVENGMLKDGDIICNIANPGRPSFIAVHDVISFSKCKCAEIPLGSDLKDDEILKVITHFNVNVIASAYGTILALAVFYLQANKTNTKIDRIWGGGQNLHASQMAIIKKAFPNATCIPFMFAGTDFGMVGYSKAELPINHYQVFNEFSKIEIIDKQSLKPITQPFSPGYLVVTNLLRKTIPILRFQTGDIAQWVNSEHSSFEVLGRPEERKASIGSSWISEKDVFELLSLLSGLTEVSMLEIQVENCQPSPSLNLYISLIDKNVQKLQCNISTNVEAFIKSRISMNGNKNQEAKFISISVNYVDFSYFKEGSKTKLRFITGRD